MSRPVTVQFYKNPDILHWGFDGYWLGADEWGDWVSLPSGSKRWKGQEEVRATRMPAVLCAPRHEWWHLHYTGPTEFSDYSLFVDISTPPIWVGDNRYEMIDLDLDVGLTADGEVVVEDEDEFEVHRVDLGYTEEMTRVAVETTERIVESLRLRKEPFFGVAESWLTEVC